MAPVEIHSSPSLIPAATASTHVFLMGYLSFVAVRTIYRSYLALTPSSATRHREPLRRGHIQIFSALALASFAVALFSAFTFSSLSYRVWAAQRGVDLPGSLFGDKGALRGGEHPGRLHLIRWLNDTSFYQDVLEIISEKYRYFWWGQQINLGLVPWSIFLAIEGRRRNISNLWAFLALSQLANLSYAQNLFFLAILLTPVPLPENVRDMTRDSIPATSSRYSQLVGKIIPTKPEGFVPKPAPYIALLLANFACIFLIPFASNTTSFMTISYLSRALPFSFLALPYIIPTRWGSIHTHPHSAHNTYTTLFQTISIFSTILHLKATAVALFSNAPASYSYRHILLHPFEKEHHPALDRASTAVSRLLGAIGEHPAVSAAGWDVLLSGISLGIWAGIRGLDVREMLRSSAPSRASTKKLIEDAAPTAISVKEDAGEFIKAIDPSRSLRRSGRAKKNSASPDADESSSSASRLRRRGQLIAKELPKIPSIDVNDAPYHPIEGDRLEEGDECVEGDWEAAALAWGIISTGGLGVGSAGVYGAEVRAR
ncbi:Uncharacterized protein BP5553_00565 [Venustampulla echinocandica]|uniref:Uncharacterized protein n=1 Tax=Venustampulla echinocandica TaxID=2656787 RepID=A0A370TYH4_9HELO|nr:Uncharacterized protein BP5553_00565 [Venustampulla echinocandica]RDL40586.1 Uncharacterized protein BP5553_00565 [Venustampulla echinocandica]